MKYFCKNSPILAALKLKRTETCIQLAELELLRASFGNTSRSRAFYSFIFCEYFYKPEVVHKDLLSRVFHNCCVHDISMVKYILNKSYAMDIKHLQKQCSNEEDGLVMTHTIISF